MLERRSDGVQGEIVADVRCEARSAEPEPEPKPEPEPEPETELAEADAPAAPEPIVIRPKCSFFTVNYNTSKLINLLIRSIRKYVKSFDYDIWIFDNSDRERLTLDEEWDDVHVIDNTRGQLIDFEKAISEYCNRAYSDIFANFISLKHALSIQYGYQCEGISDNFILCDSDIVLTSDIDFISFGEDVCVGTVIRDGKGIPRIAPFLCYINKGKCISEGISYFSQYRMHGCKNREGKTFHGHDTGSNLYFELQEHGLPLKEIDIFRHCIHFGSYSRNDVYAKHVVQDIDGVARSLGLIGQPKARPAVISVDYRRTGELRAFDALRQKYAVRSSGKRYAVYTCITGGYDGLLEQRKFEHGKFDYICFTDVAGLKSDDWRVVHMPDLADAIGVRDQTRLARFVKTHPHIFLERL